MTRPAEYVALDAINWSTLRYMAESPRAYRDAMERDWGEPSAAMQLGTLIHLALLEPHRLDDHLAVWQGTSTRTAAYREWADQHDGRILLAPRGRKTDGDAWSALLGARRSVLEHDAARVLMSHGEAEVPLYWEDSGHACKGLADWLIREPTEEQCRVLGLEPGRAVLVDLKSTRTLGSQRQIASLVAGRHYHGQLAHYARGVQAQTGHLPAVLCLLVCTAAPYDVAVVRLDTTDALDAGLRLQARLLERLTECMTHDDWPGAHPGVTDLYLPAWADGLETA